MPASEVRLGAEIAVTTALIIATATALAILPTQRQTKTAGLPSIAALQAIATEECLCAMAGAGSCESRLSQATAGMKTTQEATSSVPISYSATCFPQLGENACVGTGGRLIDGRKDDFVCTDRQFEELESLFERIDTRSGGSSEKANQALQDRIRSMREEVRRQRQK